MENHDDFHPDELLQRAVDAVLREPAPCPLPPDEVARLVAVVQDRANRPCPVSLTQRINNVKPIVRIAVAASLLIAVVGLLSWLVPGGGTSLAFADLATALANVQTATWKTTGVRRPPHGEAITSTGTGMFMVPSHERMEQTINGITSIVILDGQKNQVICHDDKTKTAVVMSFKNFPPDPEMSKFLGLRATITAAQKGKEKEVERLGVETVDGRRAEVFRIPFHNAEMKFDGETKIWADPDTSLPIRVEQSFRGALESHTVMSDFQMNAALDPALFSLDVPKGYTVQQTQLDFSKGPLSPLTEALGMAAEQNDGFFPPALHGEQGIDGLLKRAVANQWKKHGIEVDADLRPLNQGPSKLTQADYEALLKASLELNAKLPAAMASLAAITRRGDWHYAGKDVKLGTPNRPIFWCKFKNNYQVIYADLSVKEVAPQDLPKVTPSEGSPQP